jgi:hypothetical protein
MSIINLNDATPAAPAGKVNAKWQADTSTPRNVSAYVPNMVGDTGSGGVGGAVPAPSAGTAAAGKFLKADGTWALPGFAGAFVKTASYTALPGDSNALLVMNSGSPQTITLPSVPPSVVWCVFIQNIGAGALTLNPNGLNIDTVASNLTLYQGEGLIVFTDGVNYFTERGKGLAQTLVAATHKFLTSYSAITGLFTQAQPTDADLAVSDVTTNNVSTSAHGFAPKAPNDATKFLDGTGSYSAPPVAAVPGGAAAKIASYAAIAGDNSKILSFNSASPVTLTLPSPPPSATWNIEVQNTGSGVLTVSPNGLALDGSSSSVRVAQTQGLYISTDGSNYFTERGLGTVSPLTTLGDILAFSTVPARQGVGANGTCLQADSTQSTGIKWALQPYDVAFAYPGAPPNATVLQLICFRLAVAMSGNFAGSTGHCGGNPTSTAVYTVYKNGSPIGTVTIAASGGFTFATIGGASQTFVAGDTVSILTPITDATLSSVTMTFAGTR